VFQLHRSNGAISCAGKERERYEGAVPVLDRRFGRHRCDDVLYLFHCWRRLFPSSRRNARFFVRQVEIVSIGIAKAGPVARLPGKPLEESFEVREGRVQCRLAQIPPGPLAPLFRKVPLERDCLFKVKRLEVTVLGVDLETI
jgi:hypothetical protein